LSKWRFAPLGDEWMEGDTGNYWGKRMAKLRDQHPKPSAVSKRIGWSKP